MVTHDVRIDRRIMLQADALMADGWSVRVVAMPGDPHGGDSAPVTRVPDSAGGARGRAILGSYAALRRVLPMNGPAMRWLKAACWGWVEDPETFFLRAFRPVLDGMQADVVVAHDVPMLPVGAWLADRCGAQLVFDSHELWTEKNFPRAWRRAWSRVECRHIQRCDAVITVNQSIARELERRHGISRVHVITNAAPAPLPLHRSLRERCSVPPGDRILLYQGSFTSGRHLPQCVEAMHLVRAPGVHLVLLGDGVLRSTLELAAARGPAKGRIHVLPAVPQDELLAWTAGADAGLVPYVADCMNNRLCTPNKLYEFISAGLPILASDLPELRAAIVGNELGMVAELGTPMRIARAIDDFLSDHVRLSRWRASVVARRAEFGWDVQATRLQSIFRPMRPHEPSPEAAG